MQHRRQPPRAVLIDMQPVRSPGRPMLDWRNVVVELAGLAAALAVAVVAAYLAYVVSKPWNHYVRSLTVPAAVDAQR